MNKTILFLPFSATLSCGPSCTDIIVILCTHYNTMYTSTGASVPRHSEGSKTLANGISLWTCPEIRRETQTRYPSRLTLRGIISISKALSLYLPGGTFYLLFPERHGCLLRREIQYCNNLITRNRGFSPQFPARTPPPTINRSRMRVPTTHFA